MKMDKERKTSNKSTLGEYFQLGEVFRYFFRKKDPNAKPNLSLRFMHGINKISIIMFLIALLVLTFRRIFIG